MSIQPVDQNSSEWRQQEGWDLPRKAYNSQKQR
jgi:hypothetical protein